MYENNTIITISKIKKAKDLFKELDITNKCLWVLYFVIPFMFSLYSLSIVFTFIEETDDISWYICLSVFTYYVILVCAVASRFLLDVKSAIIIFLANTIVAIVITVLDYHNKEDNDEQIVHVQVKIAIGTAVCHYIGTGVVFVVGVSKFIYNTFCT